MWSGIRLWLKVILGFLLSITLILGCFTFAMFGVKAHDTVELIVTEATGMRSEVVVFSALMQPPVIHNVFWLCLAAIGFFLIFLYFIDHNYRVFLAPGVLCLAITLFLNLILAIISGFIFDYTGATAGLFIVAFFERIRQAAWMVLGLGALLIAVSYWGGKKS